MAHDGFALFVCEDGQWSLAKRYGKRRRRGATSDARLSLIAPGVSAVRLLHQYIDPASWTIRREVLVDVVKPGATPPPIPAEAETAAFLTSGSPARRTGFPAAGPTRARFHAPAGTRRPMAAAQARGLAFREKLAIIGIVAAMVGIALPLTLSAGLGSEAAMGIYLSLSGVFLATVAGVLFAIPDAPEEKAAPVARQPPRPLSSTAAGEAESAPSPDTRRNELAETARARLLRFVGDCLTDAALAPQLQSARTDGTPEWVVPLLLVGAGEASIAALAEPVALDLADIIRPALAMAPLNLDVWGFLKELNEYRRLDEGGAIVAAGREGMAQFLATGALNGRSLAGILEARRPRLANDAPPPAPEPVPSREVAILFTDLLQALASDADAGDRAGMPVSEPYKFIIDAAVTAHGGRHVQDWGDGTMAVFPRVCDAIAAASAAQRDIADHNDLGFGSPLPVRIGLAAGDPGRTDAADFAAVVAMAARLCAAAAAGEVMLPDPLSRRPGCEIFSFGDSFLLELQASPQPLPVRKLLLALPPRTAAAGPAAAPSSDSARPTIDVGRHRAALATSPESCALNSP